MRQPSTGKSGLTTRRAIVSYLPIGSIVPDPSNPRQHSLEQIRAIARSIEAFGFNAPILVDKANRVVPLPGLPAFGDDLARFKIEGQTESVGRLRIRVVGCRHAQIHDGVAFR